MQAQQRFHFNHPVQAVIFSAINRNKSMLKGSSFNLHFLLFHSPSSVLKKKSKEN